MTIDRRPEGQNGRFPMSLPTSARSLVLRPPVQNDQSEGNRHSPSTASAKARQHDLRPDIVPKTAVTVAPDRARDQVAVDGPSSAAVIDQMWQANPLQKLLPSIGERSRRLSQRCLPGRWQNGARDGGGRKLEFEAVAGGRDVDWRRITLVGTSDAVEENLRGPQPTGASRRPMGAAPVFPGPRAVLSPSLRSFARKPTARFRSDRTAPPHVPRPTVDRRDDSDLLADEPGGFFARHWRRVAAAWLTAFATLLPICARVGSPSPTPKRSRPERTLPSRRGRSSTETASSS